MSGWAPSQVAPANRFNVRKAQPSRIVGTSPLKTRNRSARLFQVKGATFWPHNRQLDLLPCSNKNSISLITRRTRSVHLGRPWAPLWYRVANAAAEYSVSKPEFGIEMGPVDWARLHYCGMEMSLDLLRRSLNPTGELHCSAACEQSCGHCSSGGRCQLQVQSDKV